MFTKEDCEFEWYISQIRNSTVIDKKALSLGKCLKDQAEIDWRLEENQRCWRVNWRHVDHWHWRQPNLLRASNLGLFSTYHENERRQRILCHHGSTLFAYGACAGPCLEKTIKLENVAGISLSVRSAPTRADLVRWHCWHYELYHEITTSGDVHPNGISYRQ